jgi:hypothetical protein
MRNFISTIFLYNYHKAIPGNQLEIFRIFIGLYSLISLLVLLVDYRSLLHPEGILGWEVSNANAFLFEFHPARLASYLNITETTVLNVLLILYGVSLAALVLGIYVKVSSALSFLIFNMLSNTISGYTYGADIYQSVSLFLLCIFPIGHRLSIIKRKAKTNSDTIKTICFRAIQIYLIITYIAAGWMKAVQPGWWDGTYIFQVLHDPTISKLSNVVDTYTVYHFKAMGCVVLIAELLYFVAMWIPFLRSVWLILIISLHVFIAFFLSLPFFGLIMIILNITCWAPYFLKDWRTLFKNTN